VLAELSALDWALLALAAFLIGVAKTALSGIGLISVVLFATILPARESTGALLPLLIVGDLFAVANYRKHASLSTLARVIPGVLPGLILGTLFLGLVDDTTMRLTIGVLLLIIGGVQLRQRLGKEPGDRPAPKAVHPFWAVAAGAGAGFATMTANAAGPIMSLYLIAAGKPMLTMLGTGAWFFLTINLIKVPLSSALGLISVSSLILDACLVPAMALGVLVGTRIVRRLRQEQFEVIVLTLSMLAATLMIATS
jgi:uncharacterized membrane protein YfcA